MPSKYKCQNLIELSGKQVCNLIANLCFRYSDWAEVFDLISDDVVEEEVKTFHVLKLKYVDFPNQMRYDIWDQCLNVWYSRRKNFPQRTGEISYFLIFYFCLDKTNLVWNYILRFDPEHCVDALVKVNANMKVFTICATMDYPVLEKALSNMRDIVKLKLNFNVTPEHFGVIGKHCRKLCQLKVSENYEKLKFDSVTKLCFENYNAADHLKYPVCTTLTHLTIKIHHVGVAMAIQNLKNLKFLSPLVTLDHKEIYDKCRRYLSQAYPCSIELLGANKYSHQIVPFTEIYRDFPKLKIFSVTCYVPQVVISHPTITMLRLFISYTIRTPFFVMPAWPNLLALSLVFRVNNPTKVDFSAIASNCPKLKFLAIYKCIEKSADVCVPFRNLEELILETRNVRRSSLLLNQVASNLKLLWINQEPSADTLEDTILDVLINISFPCLESLKFIPKFVCSKECVLNLLAHLPTLKEFGVIKNATLLNDLSREILERRWIINISQSCTTDFKIGFTYDY